MFKKIDCFSFLDFLTMDTPVFTLETIYADALENLQRLRDLNRLSQPDYETITRTYDLHNFDTLLLSAASPGDGEHRSQPRKKSVRGIVESILFRFERFGRALDMLVQSSPSIVGVNVLGFIWGSLKFIITVSE